MIGSLPQFLKFTLQKALWFTVGIEEAWLGDILRVEKVRLFDSLVQKLAWCTIKSNLPILRING